MAEPKNIEISKKVEGGYQLIGLYKNSDVANEITTRESAGESLQIEKKDEFGDEIIYRTEEE